jgi:hypothetical protein
MLPHWQFEIRFRDWTRYSTPLLLNCILFWVRKCIYCIFVQTSKNVMGSEDEDFFVASSLGKFLLG